MGPASTPLCIGAGESSSLCIEAVQSVHLDTCFSDIVDEFVHASSLGLSLIGCVTIAAPTRTPRCAS